MRTQLAPRGIQLAPWGIQLNPADCPACWFGIAKSACTTPGCAWPRARPFPLDVSGNQLASLPPHFSADLDRFTALLLYGVGTEFDAPEIDNMVRIPGISLVPGTDLVVTVVGADDVDLIAKPSMSWIGKTFGSDFREALEPEKA